MARGAASMPGSPPGRRGRLLVFAKAPLPGRVKTRLARRYGAVGAARIYRRLAEATVANAAAARPARLELWCAPGTAHPFLRGLARRHGARLRVQPPGDLGRRMDRALAEGLPAVVVGADCPGVTTAMLGEALDYLEQGGETVVGPAEDGGYVLIGMGRRQAGLFRGMPWGGPRVLAETRRRLRRAGRHWHELAASFDVDRPEDLRRLRDRGVG